MVVPQLGENALAYHSPKEKKKSATAPSEFMEAGEEGGMFFFSYLLHAILDLELQLRLGAQQALPDLVADAAAFQQRVQRLLARADVDDAVDVLGAAREEGGAEERVRHFGRRAVLVGQVQ